MSEGPARRSQLLRGDAPVANGDARYFVLLPLPEDEPVELGELELGELGELGLVDDEPDVDGEDGDDVLGDADGVELLPGRSPTRSVRLSPQALSRPRLIATAKTAVSILFISMPPLVGLRDPVTNGATAMPLPAA